MATGNIYDEYIEKIKTCCKRGNQAEIERLINEIITTFNDPYLVEGLDYYNTLSAFLDVNDLGSIPEPQNYLKDLEKLQLRLRVIRDTPKSNRRIPLRIAFAGFSMPNFV